MATVAQRVAARYKDKMETDAGNTVYQYSERQIALRNSEKAKRLEKLRGSVDKLRAQLKKDVKSSDPKTALTALAVALMDHTAERVGNPESAKEGHFGVTGWKKDHLSFSGGKATVTYVGKSGVKQKKVVTDKALVSALKWARDNCEGGELFKHSDVTVQAERVNAYLKDFDVTAKDLRGLHANQVMQRKLREIRKGELPEDKKEREKQLKDEFKKALEETAKAVGHEPSTLRSQYLVPGLEAEYMKGRVIEKLTKTASTQEIAVRVARRLLARKVEIDESLVESLRKDVLILMGNVPRIKSEADYNKLRDGIRVWRERFDKIVYKNWLNDLPYDLNPTFKQQLERYVRGPAWDFYIEIGSVPRHWYDTQELKLWDKRVRRKAQKLWKNLKDIVAEFRRIYKPRDTPQTLETHVDTKESHRLAGFDVEVRNFDPNSRLHREGLEATKTALGAYRKQAERAMPLLLKLQRPMYLDFRPDVCKGGEYFLFQGGSIYINPCGMLGEKNIGKQVKTMAHEMGHHLYRAYLSGDAIRMWETTIRGDFGPVKIQDLLAVWPEGMWTHDFVEYMAPKDSVLALQAEALMQKGTDIHKRDELEALLDRGTQTLTLPKTPISGYATKNEEEAFCEAVGLSVAYGPRAVHPKILALLKSILPGQVKLAQLPNTTMTQLPTSGRTPNR